MMEQEKFQQHACVGRALTAINSKFHCFKRKYDLQFYEKRVWVELPIDDGENVLTGNHDFPPDALPNTILNSFSHFSSENELETKNNRVILMGDFNTPGLIGNAGCPYQISIIILSSQEILYTPLRVFCDQHTAQELPITTWCLTFFSPLQII